MKGQEYAPFLSKIVKVKKHTEIEYTFSMEYFGDVKPGQFFEVSIPKYGEAPISVSGIGPDYVDLTIRRVGRVTGEGFERYEGDSLLRRGPYGNGFDVDDYKDSELVVIAGGTGVSPVRGVVEYFSHHPGERNGMTLIAGFKSPGDILFQEDFKEWDQTMDLILTVDGAEDGYGDSTAMGWDGVYRSQDREGKGVPLLADQVPWFWRGYGTKDMEAGRKF